MRLALSSDFHGMLPKIDTIPPCDAIIIAGDICPDILDQEKWLKTKFADWCNIIDSAIPIYLTWGNHDWTMKLTREWEEYLRPSVHVLVDDVAFLHRPDSESHLPTIKAWFSPWSPEFCGWAWMRYEEDLAGIYAKIPNDTQIIVSHTPPFGCGDMTMRGERVGSKALADRMESLPNLQHIVCGHIHESRGKGYIRLDSREDEIAVHNVSSVDEMYRPDENRWRIIEV